LATLLLCSAPLHGSSVVSLNIQQLTKASSDVVTGTVVDQEARFSDDGRFILTISRLKVEKQVRGKTTLQTIEVVQPGGRVGDTTQRVHGMRLLRPQDKLLLFLQPEHALSARHKVTGFTQGIYRLQRDRLTGKMMAIPSATHSIELNALKIQGKVADDKHIAKPQPLDELLRQVENTP
jgi:hypothetical protein